MASHPMRERERELRKSDRGGGREMEGREGGGEAIGGLSGCWMVETTPWSRGFKIGAIFILVHGFF